MTELPEKDAEAPVASRSLMVRPSGVSQSLSQRASLAFYKLTWRTPLYNSRLSGKLPLRLLAVPQDDLPADQARGKALMMGRFHFQGMDKEIGAVNYADPRLPPAMMDYIHRFDWLRDLAAATHHGKGSAIAVSTVEGWLNANTKKIREPAWGVENAAWRFLNMAAFAPYILSSNDPVYRSSILNHLARTARHLDRSAPRGNSRFQRLCGWVGVVAASLLLPDGKARRIVGENGLVDALSETVFEDGGVISRSPQQLIEVISILSLLRKSYDAVSETPPEFLIDALGRAVPALLGLTHADGGLGAWQGCGHIGAESVEAIAQASGVRARPHRQALDWGYQRVAASKSVLLLDAGPPPLAKQFSAGCASTLAFELSHNDQRLVINCGGSGLVGASIPATLARGLRTTAAHSTLCLDDTNSTAILPGGQLGRGVSEVGLERRDIDKATRIESSHDGYARNFGFLHSRLLIMRSDGLELRGEDILLPAGKAKPKEGVPCHVRFHIGPDIQLAAGENERAIMLRLPNGSAWLFAAGNGKVEVDESLWVDGFGKPHPTQQILVSAQTDKGGLSVGWQFRFLG